MGTSVDELIRPDTLIRPNTYIQPAEEMWQKAETRRHPYMQKNEAIFERCG
jgi:hypothetical protein